MFNRLGETWRQSPLRRRYLALSTRERLLVWTFGAVVAVLLVGGLAQSLREYRVRSVARYFAEQADLRWMRDNRSAPALRDGRSGETPTMSTIDATAKEFGLELRRIDPKGDGFNVQIDAKPFNRVLRWSHALETRHGFEIVSANIDGFEDGLVNARFNVR